MKCLMSVAAAAMALAAFAEEPAKAPEGRPSPRMMARGERPMMAGGMMMMNDPLTRAVMNPKVVEQIGLSDEQKKKLAEIRSARGGNRDLQKKVRDGSEKQAELLRAEKIDEAAVMASIDEVFEARKAIAKEQTKRIIAIRSILTPEQVSKALAAMKELRGQRPPRAQGPRGPRPVEKGAEPPKPAAE